MMILALDIATSMGWAAYDTSRHMAAIECGAIHLGCDAETGVEKRRLMRRRIDEEVCRLIDRFKPDAACLEQPLNYIGTNGAEGSEKTKVVRGQHAMFSAPKAKAPKKSGGPNADTVLMLNQLFSTADTVVRHKCAVVHEVAPRTWQTLTSRFPGDTKERSIELCRQLKIIIPPMNKIATGDAADACVIAIWAAGHCQEIKLLQRARAA